MTDKIGKKATAGEQITMTAVVQGEAQSPSGAALSPAEASVSTVLGQPSSSPSAPVSYGTYPTSYPGLPGTTVTPNSISSLFPTVTPSSTPATDGSHGSSKHKVARATSTASSLPLDPRLIGGQLAGLAVLATAITMVVARLSLRTPQPAPPSGPSGPAAPPSPETPAPQAPEPEPPAPQGSADANSDASEPKPTNS